MDLIIDFIHQALMAKEIIESGELGQIVNMKGTYGKSKMITFNQTDWRSKKRSPVEEYY